MASEDRSAAQDRYDVAKFTDREIEDELNNRPPHHRSDAYLAALRAERDRRSRDEVAAERELAEAVDKDRGYANSFVTRTMREAADENERLRAEVAELKRRLGYPEFAR